MGTIKEAINYTRELIANADKRQQAGISGDEVLVDIETVSRAISIQSEHLKNTSEALVRKAEKLKSDIERLSWLAMAKKVKTLIKLNIPAGEARLPSPGGSG